MGKHLLARFVMLLVAAVYTAIAVLSMPVQARNEAAAAGKEITVAALPREAQQTLQIIRRGGPFPYERDGAVFGNYERLLPQRSQGHYHEYTVPTPGAKDRGARRIISSGDGEYYYSDDHYRSFKRIRE
jgi:ribonuclease T1